MATGTAHNRGIAGSDILTALHTNRLGQEKSPYLLQHAHNPVEWYPWCEEAIQKAKQENKLIFLSVGYSTCHWCHVMEKESFENEEVAKIMNENFINIKVDREERPDIDKIYMTFVLMINGSGGWPMSVWLTPDLAPITAGTYFPPNDRWGMPGFKTVLLKIAEKWKSNREELTSTGISVIEAIKKNVLEQSKDKSDVLTPEGKLKQSVNIFKRNFDKEWGGFGGAPKFPEVSKINFLFHALVKTKDEQLLKIATTTLTKIANGGIHDHVFGGFARYSVDRKWHVPHFEKMLYDQGQLLMAYANAYKLTREQFYLDVADKIFKYICKDLQHPNGGYYSGEDADSLPTFEDTHKIEGAFYAWTFEEIKNTLEEIATEFEFTNISPFELFAHHYNIEETGNVEPSSDPHGHLTAKNVLTVRGSIADTARQFNTNPETVAKILSIANQRLHEVRNKRPRPHLDTKIICSWNGLILSGLAKLACIKDAPNRLQYLEAAKKLMNFIKKNLFHSETKTLLRSCYGEGTESDTASVLSEPIFGFLDDYAFLIKGLLDYYLASLDVNALHWAKELQDIQDNLFWDPKNGGYYYSQENSPNVVVRLKEDHDGAEPCGNSVSINNLLLLSCYFEDKAYKDRAEQSLEFFTNVQPFGYVLPEMMSSLLTIVHSLEMLVVVGPNNERSKQLIDVARDFYIPGMVVIHLKIDQPDDVTRKSVTQFKMIKDLPTAYFCHNRVCQLPITAPQKLAEAFAPRFIYNKCDK